MAAEHVVVSGIVRNGVVVPREQIALPEGTLVDILIPAIPPALQSEFDAWESASDEDLAAFEASLKKGPLRA